ncbi:MAG: SnoaL-like domain [Solirubrobacterales bacterium]|nr:SnoaL-like domain [Solirubrobacterales bacterium]
MSEANVEIVRRLFVAADEGDAATVFSLYDPEVEFDSTRSPLPRLVGGAASVYGGHEGLRRFFRERSEHMEDIEDTCEELIDAGEAVVSVVTTRGRGRSSGAEVTSPSYAAVWTIREGRILRVVWLPSRAEALELVGLPD